MKKYFISLSVIFALVAGLLSPLANAQEEIQRPTEAEKACENMKPAFIEKDNLEINFVLLEELQSEIDAGEMEFNYAKFEEVFEDVQDQYHEYTDCMFSYAEAKILRNVGASKGITQAMTPNFDPSVLPLIGPPIDWMTSAACLTPEKLKEIKDATVSDTMLPPLLEIHGIYSDFLDALVLKYKLEGRETEISDEDLNPTAIDQLLAMSTAYTGINRQVDVEKENALVAMDIAFKSLKELRLAFFMHVQFQCMMNNLEKYRKWLEDIRVIVDSLPDRLRDCSMTK
jgi:hypothetical protein